MTMNQRKTAIRQVAAIIRDNLIDEPLIDDPAAEARTINAGDGWTFETPREGDERGRVRHEGVRLSDDDLEEAIARAEHGEAARAD